jgi:TPR repeat protein
MRCGLRIAFYQPPSGKGSDQGVWCVFGSLVSHFDSRLILIQGVGSATADATSPKTHTQVYLSKETRQAQPVPSLTPVSIVHPSFCMLAGRYFMESTMKRLVLIAALLLPAFAFAQDGEYRECAEAGDSGCQNNLGLMYANGEGVPQNDAEAVMWIRKAVEQGHAPAQYSLGVMYRNGRGVPQNDAEAVKWYRKAADQGDANAQYNLAWMYDGGDGVPQDYAEAVKWYRKAADQGAADTQYNLGQMYRNGRGVPQNDAKAMKWYRKSAEQGYADAQYNLGLGYGKGQGVPQSHSQAYIWSSLAAIGGNENARSARDLAASKLTPEALAAAQKRADEVYEEIEKRKAENR